LRGPLSLFHGWLPFCWRIWVWQPAMTAEPVPAWDRACVGAGCCICFFVMPRLTRTRPDPSEHQLRVGADADGAAQTWVHPYVWLAGMMVGMPVLLFWPVHILLQPVCNRKPA